MRDVPIDKTERSQNWNLITEEETWDWWTWLWTKSFQNKSALCSVYKYQVTFTSKSILTTLTSTLKTCINDDFG